MENIGNLRKIINAVHSSFYSEKIMIITSQNWITRLAPLNVIINRYRELSGINYNQLELQHIIKFKTIIFYIPIT